MGFTLPTIVLGAFVSICLRFYLPSFFSKSNARLKAKYIRLDQELGWEGWDQGLA